MGLGTSPLGTGPYGYGTPPVAPSPDGPLFADATLGTTGTGRFIDPVTRQYVFDANGRIAGQGTVPQKVFLAYATVKGSSISATLGEDYSEVQTIGDDFIKIMTAKAIEPVQALIDAKLLAIDSVSVERSGTSAAIIRVNWKDLTTGREGTTTL
jgi:hypothetical protein